MDRKAWQDLAEIDPIDAAKRVVTLYCVAANSLVHQPICPSNLPEGVTTALVTFETRKNEYQLFARYCKSGAIARAPHGPYRSIRGMGMHMCHQGVVINQIIRRRQVCVLGKEICKQVLCVCAGQDHQIWLPEYFVIKLLQFASRPLPKRFKYILDPIDAFRYSLLAKTYHLIKHTRENHRLNSYRSNTIVDRYEFIHVQYFA